MASKKRKRAVEENRPSLQAQIRMSPDLVERVQAYQKKLHDGGFVISFSMAVRSLVEKGLKAVQ